MIYKRESNEYVKDGKAVCIITYSLFNKVIYQDVRYTTNVGIRKSLGENTAPNKSTIKGFSND